MWPFSSKEKLDIKNMGADEIIDKYNDISSRINKGQKVTRAEKKFIREANNKFAKAAEIIAKNRNMEIASRERRNTGLIERGSLFAKPPSRSEVKSMKIAGKKVRKRYL